MPKRRPSARLSNSNKRLKTANGFGQGGTGYAQAAPSAPTSSAEDSARRAFLRSPHIYDVDDVLAPSNRDYPLNRIADYQPYAQTPPVRQDTPSPIDGGSPLLREETPIIAMNYATATEPEQIEPSTTPKGEPEPEASRTPMSDIPLRKDEAEVIDLTSDSDLEQSQRPGLQFPLLAHENAGLNEIKVEQTTNSGTGHIKREGRPNSETATVDDYNEQKRQSGSEYFEEEHQHPKEERNPFNEHSGDLRQHRLRNEERDALLAESGAFDDEMHYDLQAE